MKLEGIEARLLHLLHLYHALGIELMGSHNLMVVDGHAYGGDVPNNNSGA